jgi:hypothetical protein
MFRFAGPELSTAPGLRSGTELGTGNQNMEPWNLGTPFYFTMSFQLMIELNTMLNSPWFCQR